MNFVLPAGAPPKVALEYLAESRYGFSLVDVGITDEDLSCFSLLDIDKNRDFNQIGDLDRLRVEVAEFFRGIGNNEESLIQKSTHRIVEIVDSVIEASGRETGWVCLRAFKPKESFELLRWHFDGGYYRPLKARSLMYKFIVTLKGPSTLFYFVSREEEAFRHSLWMSMWNPLLMDRLCDREHVFVPELGESVFFIAADKKKGALHSEPPIFESRLLFSIAPCDEGELPEVRGRVQDYFSPHD